MDLVGIVITMYNAFCTFAAVRYLIWVTQVYKPAFMTLKNTVI